MPDHRPTDLLQTVADLQHELAQCRAERDEALAQQTATAEVLQVINSSPGDLAPVFDAMLEKAMTLCGAAFGELRTYHGERFRLAAIRGVPAPYAEYMADNSRIYGSGSGTARILAGERVVHVADLAGTDLYRSDDPNRRALVDLGGARTSLHVPLLKDEDVLGSIMIYRQEPRPFTDKQIALLQNFAAHAVIAMENARLLDELRGRTRDLQEALEQQTATAEVLQVINSSPGDLAPVFDAMLDKAMRLCDVAYGSLHITDGGAFRAVAVRGMPEAFAAVLRQPIRPGPNHPVHELVAGATYVMLSDGAERDDPIIQNAVKLAGMRTALWVPLRKDDALLGYIVAGRKEARPFSDKQIALLQNFAAQAVIAMENARLITETREALEQQTATAEVLQVINASPGDLTPVFDAILEKARSLCGAVHGALVVYDGEHFRAVATHGLPEPLEGLLRTPYRPNPVHQALLRGERLTHVADQAAVKTDTSIGRASVDAGARTLLLVPLRKDGALLGYITASRWEVRPFSDKEIALLENFAAQAVIAMENARLITETREALEQQTATAEVLQVINSSPGDLGPVFDAVLEKARQLCEAAFGELYEYDGALFRIVALKGASPEYEDRRRSHPSDPSVPGSINGRVLRTKRPVLVPDVTAEVIYRTGPSNRSELVDLGGSRSLVAVPLLQDDAVLGYIAVYRREVRPFSEKQAALLQNFAAQAVIAMENARLLGELRARTDEIAGWNKELEARVAAQLAEIERTGKLRRFLAPQLADLIVAQGDESILESHRREIVVVFCDLRGFTGFAERAEPEEVMALLGDYHAAMGPIVASFEGTLDHYAGDGIMVFFNDPLPTPDPARRAIDMAVAMRAAAQGLLRSWRRRGHDIGFGVGISQGYATLGQIGFAERMDYTAIGTVTNLTARLCAEAKDGQILVSRRVAIAVEDSAELEEIGDLSLKGLSQAVLVYNVPQ